ncbi:hypothetical protein L1987_70331 [Smallanthus sonchifolius]|uniref:Uncharacterized protein n=1 Tax=Smallanthus sonchifolius TaxID=185202 RepID=A0ACB9APD8_9ASTR|nr:hypothetical protein L1987_70331 [Smallanthus sonchifolius]
MSSAPSSFSMAPSSPVTVHRPPGHSPVPYLFGGLATIMGLIAFALLILACSYWKLSRNLRNAAASRDLEAGAGAGDGDSKPDNNKILTVYEEMYVVVMAGEQKPTFLATPSSSRTSSFGSNSCRSSNQVQVSTVGNRESAEHVF